MLILEMSKILPKAFCRTVQRESVFSEANFCIWRKKPIRQRKNRFFVYKTVAETMAGKRVIIRTLDIGADKQADYFALDKRKSGNGTSGDPYLSDSSGDL